MEVKVLTYKLKAKRVEKGIKQSDLAKLLGISRQSLSDIEHRRIEPRRDLMLKIADALNEDVSILFFNE
ncbi:MAG: helix-turn-helix transcriptional regulator [Clostridiaceae bacterium]|jgi:putative transcriptional regulator|nr:helix-turn-helix transcriptional regulator [Clostridiaceae bacterium]